jgi:predicted O-methyltransferase YrrM
MTEQDARIQSYLDDFVDRLYSARPRPPTYLCGALRKPEMKILMRLFLRKRPRRSLEWGLGSGISAAAFGEARRLLNLQGRHIVLDPFQQEICGGWGLRCLEEFNVTRFVEFLPVKSGDYLSSAIKSDENFDFIFIDGDHEVDSKMIDAKLSLDVLANDGIVCFHDSFFSSTASAITYLTEEHGLEFLPLEGELVLKRLLRALKHSPRMGWRFSSMLAPSVHYSLAALCKRQ